MSTSLLYRLAGPDDTAQLKALGILAYHEFLQELTDDNQRILNSALHNESNIKNLIEKATCFVCNINNRIAGMAYLMPSGNPTKIYPADWAYIRMVGVDPAHRGLGIARQLTQQCIDHAKAGGEQVIGLHTSEMMGTARHIYESLGFKIVREIDPIFGKRYWLYALTIAS